MEKSKYFKVTTGAVQQKLGSRRNTALKLFLNCSQFIGGREGGLKCSQYIGDKLYFPPCWFSVLKT